MAAARDLLIDPAASRASVAVPRLFRAGAAWEEDAGEVAFYRALVPAGALAFDIGANVGDVSGPLLRAGARVVAVEPQPQCVERLRTRCGRHPGLSVVQAVVGRAAGTATLHLRPNHPSSSLRADWRGETIGTLQSPMVTLAELIGRHGTPAYCKVDVEGVEEAVFSTLPRPLPLVSFEYVAEELGRVEECLRLVAPDGRAEVNLTHPGPLRFVLPRWIPLADFRRTLADRLAAPDVPGWGDVWVRRVE